MCYNRYPEIIEIYSSGFGWGFDFQHTTYENSWIMTPKYWFPTHNIWKFMNHHFQVYIFCIVPYFACVAVWLVSVLTNRKLEMGPNAHPSFTKSSLGGGGQTWFSNAFCLNLKLWTKYNSRPLNTCNEDLGKITGLKQWWNCRASDNISSTKIDTKINKHSGNS